jgi:hypothetical protein
MTEAILQSSLPTALTPNMCVRQGPHNKPHKQRVDTLKASGNIETPRKASPIVGCSLHRLYTAGPTASRSASCSSWPWYKNLSGRGEGEGDSRGVNPWCVVCQESSTPRFLCTDSRMHARVLACNPTGGAYISGAREQGIAKTEKDTRTESIPLAIFRHGCHHPLTSFVANVGVPVQVLMRAQGSGGCRGGRVRI